MLTPQQQQQQLLGAVNQLNKEAHVLNQGIAPNEGVKSIPLVDGIRTSPQPAQPAPVQSVPVQPAPVQSVPVQSVPVQSVPVQSVPVQPQQDLSPLINKITSLEKQVTRFVNLIERNVAKNAKEINIRIKLNDKYYADEADE